MDSNRNLAALLGVDRNKNVCYVSPGAEFLTGYPPSEIETHFFSKIIPQEAREALEEALASGEAQIIPSYIITKTGGVVSITMTVAPTLNQGKISHHISFYSAETIEKRWLAEILEHSEDAIIKKDLDGIITDWNPAATRLFGYKAGEAIGKHISLIIPEDRLHEEDMIIQNIRDGKNIMHFNTERRAKNGDVKFLSLNITPIRDSQGKVIGASKIAHDIAAEKKATSYLARLAAIVNSSDDAIISKTLDGIITSWNKAAEAMFGYHEDEAIGKQISIIIPKERLDEENMIINNIRAGKRVDHFETVRIAKGGRRINISLTVSPMKDEDGNVIGASKIARDIDFKIQADAQKAMYIKRLQELNQYKDDFMVMASHELKTPLTVILANLQILGQVMKDEESVPLLKKTIDKAFQMSKLISDLLDVSKIQVGKLELQKSDYDFHEQIRDVISNLSATTNKHRINLLTDLSAVMIHADKERMQHVLINLIENAIKYSPAGGEITIRFSATGSSLELSVSDQGVGIHAEDLQNIFQRFYRGRIASSFSGSGIGLFISSQIVKNHGGDIRVESEESKGTTFSVRLPR